MKVFIGVDPHKLSATIEVVDKHEMVVLATGRFATDAHSVAVVAVRTPAGGRASDVMGGRMDLTYCRGWLLDTEWIRGRDERIPQGRTVEGPGETSSHLIREVHAMIARTTPAIATAVLVAALTLGGCGGDDGAPESEISAEPSTSRTTTSEDPTSEPAVAGRIPDGRYSRVATEADFEAAGLSEDLREEFLGRDGEMPTALEVDGERYTHYVTNDAGVEEVGELGTLDYDEQGRLVMTSESTGCPGCVGTVEWSLDGHVLELTTPQDWDPVDAFVVGGEYTREG